MTKHHYSLLFLMGLALFGVACEKYDAPPQPSIANITDGVLPDPSAPLVIQFHEPVKDGTLAVRVVLMQTAEEGELLPDAQVFFDSNVQSQGTGSFNDARTKYTIQIDGTLPVGPRLGLEIASGLSDDDGNKWEVTQIIEFAYGFQCDPEEELPTTFPSAVHFFLLDVEKPLAVQLQLMADIRVNAATGRFIGQVTNADRDPATECGLECAAEEVCRTIPAPACVMPSERAVGTNEHPDFFANNDPPAGYSFTVTGCVRDQPDGSWAFANDPAEVNVAQPEVRVVGLTMNASFARGEDGLIHAAGTASADDTLLGALMISSGSASGSVSTVEIPADQVKPGVPEPPAAP